MNIFGSKFKAAVLVPSLLLSLLLLGSSAMSESPLVFSNSHSWAPMSYRDDAGEEAGLIIDFWRLYAEYNEQPIEFLLVDWGDSIEAVREGKAQVHAGLLESPERRRFLTFSKPIFPLVTGLFIRRDQENKGELIDLSIGVITKSYEEEYMRRTYNDLNLIQYANNREMIESVHRGDADAFVADFPTGVYFIGKLKAEEDLMFYRFLYSKPIHAAVSLENASLIKQIDEGIDKIPTVKVKHLVDKWQPVTTGNEEGYSTYLLWLSLLIGLVLIVSYYLLVVR